MTPRTWTLAIDFGTTATVAAVQTEGERPQILEVDGQRRLPSVVLVDDDGSIVVGSAAAGLASARPDRAVRAPKSRLGEQVPVVLGGQPHQATTLVAEVLRHVLAEAVRHQGGPPLRCRLTYPATWNRPQRARFLEAATKAGLPDPELVPEPVAAALTYAEQMSVPSGSHVAVYDLGGGTFDTAVLQSTTGGFKVVGRPLGDQQLGGELFDEMLMNFVGERIDASAWEQILISEEKPWRRAAARLRDECTRVKETLSTHSYGEISVGVPSGMIELRVERHELEELVSPYIDESLDLLERCVADAGIATDDLAAIYVTGGASRMPLVEEKLRAAFPDVVISRQGDPKTAVALGALVATPASLDLSLAASPERTTVEGSSPPPPPSVDPSTGAPPPPAPPSKSADQANTTIETPLTPPPSSPPPSSPLPPSPPPPKPPAAPAPVSSTPVAAASSHGPPPTAPPPNAPAAASDDWYRKPVVLAAGGVIAIIAIIATIIGLTGGGDPVAEGTNTTIATSVTAAPPTTGLTTAGPTTAVSAPETTTVPATTSPTTVGVSNEDRPTVAEIENVVVSLEEMGPGWVSAAPGEDEPICDIGVVPEPVRSVIRLYDPVGGLNIVPGNVGPGSVNVTEHASQVDVYATTEEAAEIIAIDQDLGSYCGPGTFVTLEGVSWSVEFFTAEDGFPDLGDGTAAAGLILTSALDASVSISILAVEVQWGRSIVGATTYVFGRQPNDEEIKILTQNITNSFLRLQVLPK